MTENSYEAGYRRGQALAANVITAAKNAEPRVYDFEPYCIGMHDGFKLGLATEVPIITCPPDVG